MSESHAGLPSGHFTIHAQERVIFGQPAAAAVLAEVKRLGASRVFVTSTRSLAKLEHGPLQRVERALGSAHVGTYTAISSHSPREDAVTGANQARAAKADLLVAIGGGSVIDATKAMQLCLWMGLDKTEVMEPYRAGLKTGSEPVRVPADPIRMVAISTTLSASEFTPAAGVTDSSTNTKQTFIHRLIVPRSVILDPESTLDRRTGCFSARASARWITQWKATAPAVPIRRPSLCRCRA
ncbi:MAG: iron-containing alcohol dehydrogenase [Sphingomonadales bacterium]|nr:iron-containing alcohol dehydrogenase [Sphingomonadales bacterium]